MLLVFTLGIVAGWALRGYHKEIREFYSGIEKAARDFVRSARQHLLALLGGEERKTAGQTRRHESQQQSEAPPPRQHQKPSKPERLY